MPTREEIDLKERADRALRTGHPAEALGLYDVLLGHVQVFAPGVYDGWLEGALAAYQALGRRREAAYVLLGLRRFADAARILLPGERPLEWALAASKLGQHAEAARVLAGAGHPVLAAVELERGDRMAAARAEWERALGDPRLVGRPYELALVHFNLGECLLKLGDAEGAARAFTSAGRQLEEVADAFETRGERERAFDCYTVLLRIGKDTGSFENVSEGYVNAIRILKAGEQRFYVLQYYEDFINYAVERGELYAAATLAREAADYSAHAGLVYDKHYLGRAVALWADTARANETAGGPMDLTENAFHAGIDAATALGDLAQAARLYDELAALPVAPKQRDRYKTLARRYAGGRPSPPPTAGIPEYLRRAGAYQDVWRQDLIEWELDGDPIAVAAGLVVDRTDHVRFSRLALRALLIAGATGFSTGEPAQAAELSLALGRVQVYEVLRPLEKIYESFESPEARAAVMAGVGQVYCRRSFGLVRQGIEDRSPRVREAAIAALRGLRFRDAFDDLSAIFKEKTDERIRIAALEALADLASPDAGAILLEAVLRETGAIQATAETRLRSFSSDDLVPAIRQAIDLEGGESHPALRRIWAALAGGSGP
ncbi:MAG TPA: HEAT repeat domain-containing protein [Polyangia bacterium]|jgi:tetratricopeptide (TPR) repeat protein